MNRSRGRHPKRREERMSRAVARHIKPSALDVRIGRGCTLDVVAFDKERKVFKIIECKYVKDLRRIGHAYGQLLAYYSALKQPGSEFLDAFAKKTKPEISLTDLMGATQRGKNMQVEFYVGLRDAACKDVHLLRSMKKRLPRVGIIRVKRNGQIRDYIRDQDGRKDRKLTQAKKISIAVMPPRVRPGNSKSVQQ